MLNRLLLLALCGSTVLAAAAAPAQPESAVFVDCSDVRRGVFHSHVTLPAAPGPMTFVYPKWIPGEHMADGPIINMAGLKFTGGGKAIAWRRDLVDMFAFHLDIPQGVSSLDINFDFLFSAPVSDSSGPSAFSAGASATAFLSVLSWNQVVLYPKGYDVANLIFAPSLRLPTGWKFGTALPGAKTGRQWNRGPAQGATVELSAHSEAKYRPLPARTVETRARKAACPALP